MALTITNPDGTTPVVPKVPGTRKHVITKLVLDTSYPAGGYTLTAANFGLLEIRSVIVGSTVLGRIASAILSSGVWKLQLFSAVTTEVSDTTDVHLDSVFVEMYGI